MPSAARARCASTVNAGSERLTCCVSDRPVSRRTCSVTDCSFSQVWSQSLRRDVDLSANVQLLLTRQVPSGDAHHARVGGCARQICCGLLALNPGNLPVSTS